MSARPDPDDDAEVLARERDQHMAVMRGIPRRRAELADSERAIVRYARLLGIGWDDIAEAIGSTADAALGQYGEPEPGADPF